MKVTYSYLLKQFAQGDKGLYTEDIISKIRKLLETGEFTLGPEVSEFEFRFAKLCKSKYAIGVNSGTDALILSLKALGISSGDEVITAPNSFIATVGAIVATGARPVFVDVDEQYTINSELIEEALTNNTKAIIPVHYTGNPADMQKIIDIAKEHDLYVIEDACQAINASIDGQTVGSFGDTAAFSLHPLKNINVWGDSGVIVTNSEEWHNKLKLLRNHGLITRDEVEIFGLNSRLDTLQAIVANRLLVDVEEITNKRIENAKQYDEALSELPDYITIPPRKDNIRQVYHIYMIQVKERDRLYKYLLENEIEAKIHYSIPLHLQKASKYLGYKMGDFPVCEEQAKRIISLPNHQYLSNEEITYVVDHIKKFYRWQ